MISKVDMFYPCTLILFQSSYIMTSIISTFVTEIIAFENYHPSSISMVSSIVSIKRRMIIIIKEKVVHGVSKGICFEENGLQS